MIAKSFSLLSAEEYTKYQDIIPNINCLWWLKTPAPDDACRVRIVDYSGTVVNLHRALDDISVRPCCILEPESVDLVYWQKQSLLVGAKISFKGHQWTILDIQCGELFVLCDEVIAKRYFDLRTTAWATSDLRAWLKGEFTESIITKK